MPTPLCRALLLALTCLLWTPPAFAVYRCELAGRMTYTDLPCDGTRLGLPASPPAQAPASDLLARERAEVSRLQKLREQRERQDRQIRDLAARGAAAREKKCRTLALQLKWREEDLRDAPPDKAARARTRARRAAEKFRVECP